LVNRTAPEFRARSLNTPLFFPLTTWKRFAPRSPPISEKLRESFGAGAGNAGLYLPEPGYLEALREITRENDSLLIFDEVMTGFRLAWRGSRAILAFNRT